MCVDNGAVGQVPKWVLENLEVLGNTGVVRRAIREIGTIVAFDTTRLALEQGLAAPCAA